MRHLFSIGRGSAANVHGSNLSRIVTFVRVATCATLVLAVAMPLQAQKSSRSKTAKAQARAAAPPAVPAAAESQPTGDSAAIVASVTPFRDGPSSAIIGALQKATAVDVIARDHGWTRVRVEGWVPDSLLVPADTTYRAGLSAADLRADPVAVRGKTVLWNVQFLALQTADPLRHGLADGEPYMLVRGPNSENALLYLVVPPSLMGTARALQPLEKITVTARVRDGKSDPVGVPILDIQTIRRIR